MSRAAVSKSRADKGKPPAAQTPVIAHEIVPGKFNDNDWNYMLDKDASENYILDILDEVLDKTMDTIYKDYIQRQLLPFTISQAKDAILQIIDWQFLARDEGETNVETDTTWLQDEEPDPAVTDCWAQGSVPRTFLPPTTPVIPEETEPQEEEEIAAEETQAIPEVQITEEEPELPDKVSEPDEDRVEERTETEPPAEQKVVKEKKKPKLKFKPYKGRLRSAGVTQMTESLEETEMKIHMSEMAASLQSEDRTSGMLNMPASCQSILRVQAGRPPGHKDVVYDELGNVIAVVKLDPEKLPNHRVRVKYQVVDPATEAAQARLEAMRHGKYAAQSSSIRRIHSKKTVMSETASVTKSVKSSSKTAQQPIIAPLPPPLIESMEVVAGVTVKEGGRVKKGPNRYVRKADVLEEHQKNLRPVATRVPAQGLDVSDLLDRTTPVLRPIGESPPLPPIIPHPPTQSRIST